MPTSLKYCLLSCLLMVFGQQMHAQQKAVLKGSIIDEASGEPLIGATIWAPSLKTGASTDESGFFALSADWEQENLLVISYIGYTSDTILYRPATDGGELNFRLASGVALDEVVITDGATRRAANIRKTQMGYIDLKMEEVNRLPALLSENDVLKAIQLLPGIQSSEGATTGFYVRGGSSDQNLILLNDATIYNPFHAAGFISVFNGDIIGDISIHKSAFPSVYGGRISSLLNIETREPSMNKVTGSAGIGLVTARLTMDIPVVKDKLALTISGRGFYSYSLYRAFANEAIKKNLPQYYFYDAFTQLHWQPGPKDRIELFYYSGKDLISFQDRSTTDSTRFTIPWSNTAMGASWRHNISDRTISRVRGYYSTYDFQFAADYTDGGQALQTGIREGSIRAQVDISKGGHFIQVGVQSVYQDLEPRVTRDITNTSTSTTTRIADARIRYQAVTTTAYLNDDWTITPRFGINYGVRLPLYIGSGVAYASVDPKIVLRYQVNAASSVKASYSYGSQFVHMMVSSTATTPLDLWMGSSERVKPQRAHAVAVGWYQNFKDNQYEWSLEGYYKKLNNQLEYKEGADVFSQTSLEDKILSGDGWTYGTEFYLRKRMGKVTGFAGYTLSWAQRQFDALNEGRAFDYKYDRRHDMTFSVHYQFHPRWSVSALFVIGSAQALTVPQGVSFSPTAQGFGTYIYDYEERNSFRLRPYHRLDLSLQYSGKPRKTQSHLKLDIYNTYNQKNSFFVYLDTKGTAQNGAAGLYLRDYSLIPIMPSVSYQIDF